MDKGKLQKLYKELWYNTPNNLKQELSNSFILDMSRAKFENFTNQRALETWARKEREKRIDILLAIHDLDDILAEETKYMKMKNILWQLN